VIITLKKGSNNFKASSQKDRTLSKSAVLLKANKFGPKGDGRMEKIAYEELCDLYSSPSIIRIIKSRRM
jgi:hypothetical protein